MIIKRSKQSRRRGHKTHGYGSMKKNRGAGHRGGRGNAGSGKRGDSKKPSYQKKDNYMGKHGFKSKVVKAEVKTISIKCLEQHLEEFMGKDIASKNNDLIEVNLKKAGYTKLLGAGQPQNKYLIRVLNATEKSIKKIETAGGKVESEGAPETKGKDHPEKK
jgi:large subunit ribosomal protein L15